MATGKLAEVRGRSKRILAGATNFQENIFRTFCIQMQISLNRVARNHCP